MKAAKFSYNDCTLAGVIGRIDELKAVGSTQLIEFSVALSKSWKDKTGEWQEKTTWANCKAWGKQAEYISRYMSKGQRVFIKASFDLEEWTTDNVKRQRAVFIVSQINAITKMDSEYAATTSTVTSNDTKEDDLPF